MSKTWTTQDGRVLDPKWMDSQHLINAINLIIRNQMAHESKAGIVRRFEAIKHAVWMEAKARELINWVPQGMPHDPYQLCRPNRPRESTADLCAMHACRHLCIRPLIFSFDELARHAEQTERYKPALAYAVALRMQR